MAQSNDKSVVVNGDCQAAIQGFSLLLSKELPVQCAFRLRQAMKKIEERNILIHEQWSSMLTSKFAELNKDGTPKVNGNQVVFLEGKKQEAEVAHRELFGIVWEDAPTIPVSLFGDASVPMEALWLLGPFITDK